MLPGALRARLASPTPSVDPRAALRARGTAGPAATPPMFGCDHHRGGTCAPPRSPPPLGGGDGGGRAPFPASAVLARYGWGTVWDLFPSLVAPDVLAVQHSFANSYHPKRDKQVPSMKLPRRLTVSLSLAIAEAPTVLSLIGCTRLRAVSGILRTQRGRRGSGLRRLRADTAYAGLARRSRPFKY
jgi:hypothetical protein